MNSLIEWRLLRKQLILLFVMVVQMIGCVLGGLYYQEEMSTQVEAMQKRLQVLLDKKRAQEEQTRLLGQYKPAFDAYQARGAFEGEEPRLRWVEHVLEVEKALTLPVPLRFKLDVRKPYTPAVPTPGTANRLFASSMEVTLGLLHEGDLLYFFNQLANRGYGVYDVRACRMERVNSPSGDPGALQVEAHVNAVCQINWYWYDLAKEPGRGGP